MIGPESEVLSKRILCVEDEAGTRRIVKQVLKQSGFKNVELVENGGAGLQLFRNAQADLLLLDIGLPDINGLDILADVKQSRPDFPVVMLTMQSDQQVVSKALELGCDGYVLKPITAEQLVNTITKALS